MNSDRISDLPEDVIDQILSLLPIKDAVRTSVLSTEWRKRWETVSTLVFDEQSLPIGGWYGVDGIVKLVRDINWVLMLRSGPIRKFALSYERNLPFDEINKWIRYLSRHSPRELVLKISNSEGYLIPPCTFSCQQLTRLVLFNCFLIPPSTFKGFKHLKSLDLAGLTVARDVLERLIRSSPLLESLTMYYAEGFDRLVIDAPNLLSLNFDGEFVDISLKNTSRLSVCSVNSILFNDNFPIGGSNHGNLVKLLSETPQIGRLCIRGVYFAYLAGGYIPRELPAPCSNLYHLTVDINFTSFNGTSTLLCLLRSVPNLRELRVKCCLGKIWETCVDMWEASRWNRSFTRLRCVDVSNFSGVEAEMDFVRSILLLSPVLESMVVKLSADTDDCYKVLEILRRVCCFKRASPLAEINILDL